MNTTDLALWAFVVLAALATLALLASRWPGWGKLLLVLGVTALYFVAERGFQDAWGWPSRAGLPERFVLLAVVVEEPTPRDPGRLFVWVNGLEDGAPLRQPRAYQLPYSKNLHGMLEEAMKKSRQGVTQVGTATARAGQAGPSWLRPGSEQPELKIGDLPVPQLPEK